MKLRDVLPYLKVDDVLIEDFDTFEILVDGLTLNRTCELEVMCYLIEDCEVVEIAACERCPGYRPFGDLPSRAVLVTIKR